MLQAGSSQFKGLKAEDVVCWPEEGGERVVTTQNYQMVMHGMEGVDSCGSSGH